MTKIQVTVPSARSVQLRQVLLGLGVGKMVVSEVPPSSEEALGAAFAAPRSSERQPKIRVEIVTADVLVEPILQALLAWKRAAAG